MSIKFVLNKAGVRELLKSNEMSECVKKYADKIANAANNGKNGYKSGVYNGKNRVNASVYADSSSAKKDNSKNNTLLKALGSMKG